MLFPKYRSRIAGLSGVRGGSMVRAVRRKCEYYAMTDYPVARHIGAVNWLGLWTLYLKEVRRFLNVATQTVAAPMTTTLLFLAIFTLALGRAVEVVNGISFARFSR